MTRIRYVVVAALAAAAIGLGAPPASATCQPDVEGGCCSDDLPNVIWRKYFGHDLYQCPW